MTDDQKENFAERLFADVFRQMGARPETLIIPNVLLTRESELELYVKGGRPEIFLSEQQGTAALREGESLYKVKIYRVR